MLACAAFRKLIRVGQLPQDSDPSLPARPSLSRPSASLFVRRSESAGMSSVATGSGRIKGMHLGTCLPPPHTVKYSATVYAGLSTASNHCRAFTNDLFSLNGV